MDSSLKVKITQQPICSKQIPLITTCFVFTLLAYLLSRYLVHNSLPLLDVLHQYLPMAMIFAAIFSVGMAFFNRTTLVEISPADQLDMDKLLARFDADGYKFVYRRNQTVLLRKGRSWLGANINKIYITTNGQEVLIELPSSTFGQQYLSGDFSPAKLHK